MIKQIIAEVETYKENFSMKIWILAILFVIVGIPAVQAHPHVFITPKAEIIMNNHSLSQINVEWDFDEMSTSLYVETCGSNEGEIHDILFPKNQKSYFTNVEIDGNLIDNLIPSDFKAESVNGSLHCKFTLYINQNVDNTLKIWFDDPTIFNNFTTSLENFLASDQQTGINYVLQKQTQNDIDKISFKF